MQAYTCSILQIEMNWDRDQFWPEPDKITFTFLYFEPFFFWKTLNLSGLLNTIFPVKADGSIGTLITHFTYAMYIFI